MARSTWVLTCLLLILGSPAAADREVSIAEFSAHYEQRLGPIEIQRVPIAAPPGERVRLVSPLLRGDGNYPVLMLHAEPVADVIVLTHGLTDSPYYMSAIARGFYDAGANVVLPLLPAHGLLEPNEAMEDDDLPEKWKAAEVHAVEAAQGFGQRVSVGGFSTGGALSVNVALTRSDLVTGAVYLFSAALAVGSLNELAGGSLLIAPAIALSQDGDYEGVGPNPYKYPHFTRYGGLRLTALVKENRALYEKQGPVQPVFAVHSIHDEAVFAEGIGDLLRSPGIRGVAIVVASNPPIERGSLVLAEDITLDPTVLEEGEELPPTPRANPSFQGMMDLALEFFRKQVQRQERKAN